LEFNGIKIIFNWRIWSYFKWFTKYE